ncbi:MAG: SRPBCC family protein [Solirubrobacteraceae bacterium]|nr:SRPBCC family protein [Patulibacter sp.]
MTRLSQTLTTSIDRPPQAVYDYIRDPRHMPTWAPGFTSEVHEEDGTWIAQTTEGPVTVAFVPDNDFLIADHVVTVSDTVQVLNPIRVLPNAEGAEVIFTVVQEEGQNDAEFEEILALVSGDLALLKRTLEGAAV